MKPPRKRLYHLTGEAQVNDDGTARQALIADLWPGETVLLRREPDNPFDVNAIAATDEQGRTLGYLAASHAANLAPLFDAGLVPTAKIHRINGGVKEYPTLGVQLCLTWAGQKPMTAQPLDAAQKAFRNRKPAKSSGGCMGMVAALGMVSISAFHLTKLFS